MGNILTHHGIKGQKWGVRRGPPYPLKQVTSNVKAKSVKTDSDGKYKRALRDKGKACYNRVKNMPISSRRAGSNEELIAYAAMTALTAAGILVSRKVSLNRDIKYLEKKKNEWGINSLDSLPRIKGKMLASQSVKKVNPGYPGDGRTMNCTFCTTAMALREKGYDVTAATLTEREGMHDKAIFGKGFDSPSVKMPRKTTAQSAMDILASNGEGSYGSLCVAWTIGGGHSMFWKIENGKPHIYDGQNGEEYTASEKSFNEFKNHVVWGSSVIVNRLDNCEPTDYVLGAVEPNKNRR